MNQNRGYNGAASEADSQVCPAGNYQGWSNKHFWRGYHWRTVKESKGLALVQSGLFILMLALAGAVAGCYL